MVAPSSYQEWNDKDFPGGPVAKTLYPQCRGLGFDPWSRTIPHAASKSSYAANKYPSATTKTLHRQKKKKKKKNEMTKVQALFSEN